MEFLTCPADIIIGGGAAGAGKTVALLIDAARHADVDGYGAIIFRVSFPQIMMQGGLWDESQNVFPIIGGMPNTSRMEWNFREPGISSRIAFRHLGHENELIAYQGAQIPYIGFDELTHFSFKMFLYMLTRNRSTCGVDPVIRATCNPDPDSWLADFISWWIDQETGFPIPERAGVLRFFIMYGGDIIWGNSKQEVIDTLPEDFFDDDLFRDIPKEKLIKSITFIPGTISDNPELMKKNPQYLANLLSQDEETQMRLLRGNWRIRSDKLSLFDYLKIADMFTNNIPDDQKDQLLITCDHARFGRDLCVIGTWKGWRIIRLDILPKSATQDVLKVINMIRIEYRYIPSSQIMVDQDGIGVSDSLACRTFHGGGPALKLKRPVENEPGTNKSLTPDYKNLRTQCYYHLAEEKVNKGQVSIDLKNVWLHEIKDGIMTSNRTDKVKLASKDRLVRELIRDDLRTAKREDPDAEKKKQMVSKELQKQALGGRSPDFGDMMAMRSAFDFVKKEQFLR